MINFRKITQEDKKIVLSILQECNIEEVKENEIVNKHFENECLGCIAINYIPYGANIYIGYCFIKNPQIKPETLSVVHSLYRKQGIATKLRNYTIETYKDQIEGNLIYSYSDVWNIASIKSLLNSRYEINDFIRNSNGNNVLEFIHTIKR
jgi:RimJ/RimL family protein N-acetyltransferase